MTKFKLVSEYTPINAQKKAIDSLTQNIQNGVDKQVLLGVTGSGKTFTAANVIEKLNRPALVISHNKTLAAQLYQEFKSFFPDNAVSYFVSYYDYYQPEAYIPSTDTYIEKDADINEMIDKLRLAATANLLTRDDVIVVASVSCIYNIGSPKEYGNFIFEFKKGNKIDRKDTIGRLIELQYERNDFGFNRGTFRLRGNTLDIFPAYQDEGIRVETDNEKISKVTKIDPLTGNILENDLASFILYPAKHFIADPKNSASAFDNIRKDMEERVAYFKSRNQLLEAQRIAQKVTYDLEMIQEVGYVKGIENYSRYFDGRKPGDAPNSLLDYFNYRFDKDWLLIADESHITFPQVRGMYAGDQSRKQTLIDYGFRLPSALDNRPLTFDEFTRKIPGFIAVSATPADWELSQALESAQSQNSKVKSHKNNGVVEQLIRPTGIPDPLVEIRPVDSQVADVIKEIQKRTEKGQRTLVTTLTKKTAEDLSKYLEEKGVKVQYLHSDVITLERTEILDDLRRGNYDVLVGVNLLREGLDLPEVTLVAILDADKEGFLRSAVSLIQTMGRAARHVEGTVILYADTVTKSIQFALDEVGRRRVIQIAYNKEHNITPSSIHKPLRDKFEELETESALDKFIRTGKAPRSLLPDFDTSSLTPMDKKKLAKTLRTEMKLAANELNFELAAELRDKIKEIGG